VTKPAEQQDREQQQQQQQQQQQHVSRSRGPSQWPLINELRKIFTVRVAQGQADVRNQ